MKIKHSLPFTLQSIGEHFFVKSFPWGNKHFGQIYEGMFYMGINDQIMKEGRGMGEINGQEISKVESS